MLALSAFNDKGYRKSGLNSLRIVNVFEIAFKKRLADELIEERQQILRRMDQSVVLGQPFKAITNRASLHIAEQPGVFVRISQVSHLMLSIIQATLRKQTMIWRPKKILQGRQLGAPQRLVSKITVSSG